MYRKSFSRSQIWKIGNDTVNDGLKKRKFWMLDIQGDWCMIGLNGRGLSGGMLGHSPGDELLTLMRCLSCWLLQLYEDPLGWRVICDQTYNLCGKKGGRFFFFLLF